ncbi:MAG: BrnT family toxin [Gemmatimonadota bacterium]
MPEIRFEWDLCKARSNQRKHGVSFEEAASAFYDDDALVLEDPEHSGDEDRFILQGLSSLVRLLVVIHCFRDADDTIRIISARKATPAEAGHYESRLRP